MDSHPLPVVEQKAVQLTGDPRRSRFHGPWVQTWLRWPSLGVSILHSIVPMERNE